jgi:serine protease AprX
VEAAWKKGIVVVVAAGNLGRNSYATVLAPGNSPRVITVGAMKAMGTYPRGDDLVASYSSKGPTYIDLTAKPDLVAPGNLVVSALAPGSNLAAAFPGSIVSPAYYNGSPASPGQYIKLSGTSMAAPAVAGAVALMLQKSPTITPDTVKARLMKTARKSFPAVSTNTDPTTHETYVSTYDLFTIGAGYLDVQAALASPDVALKSTASPAVVYSAETGEGTLAPGSSSLWNSTEAWSSGAVWGTAVLASGEKVWGASDAWSTFVVWGTNEAWGMGGPSGTFVVWGTTGNGE